jgi:hypothetical protein
MFFKNRCYNGGKKHKFQPRYSTKSFLPPELLEGRFHVYGGMPVGPFKTKIRTYVCDVCVWCGRIVKEKQDA